MRTYLISIATALSLSASAFAYSVTPASDPCRSKALDAAQDAYGNDPFRSTIETVVAGQSYKVTVGYGNPEDGPHLYDVTFANGCNSTADAEEAPEVAINPLQDDTHTVYNQLVSYNTEIPASDEISASELPAKAQKAYAAREKNLQSIIPTWAQEGEKTSDLKVTGFKIEVDGQDTYAILSPNLDDSIREYLIVLDSKGNEIDSAAVYHESDVGQNGVSWQDESVQK